MEYFNWRNKQDEDVIKQKQLPIEDGCPLWAQTRNGQMLKHLAVKLAHAGTSRLLYDPEIVAFAA